FISAIPTSSRVHLVRTPGKQFGLHIRTGVIQYYTKNGYETVPAFFISRLTEDGIAYNTGLLAVNDEIIEVNGIEVYGKSLDQVNDMMVANSSNLIITIRPADQSMCLPPPREISRSRFSPQNSDLLYGPRKNIGYAQSPGQQQLQAQVATSRSSGNTSTTPTTTIDGQFSKMGLHNGVDSSTIQINEEVGSDDDMNVGLITI
ncbi:unnamed protein product, partial [Trichobilharzia regenti]